MLGEEEGGGVVDYTFSYLVCHDDVFYGLWLTYSGFGSLCWVHVSNRARMTHSRSREIST